MTDYRNKLDSFHKALERLLEGIQLYTGKDGGVDDLIRDVGFKPDTSIDEGIGKFVKWYREYYQV